MKNFIYFIIVVVIVFAVILFSGGSKVENNFTKEELSKVLENDYVEGKVDSKVVFIEYLDFQCPACKAYAPFMDEAKEAYGDRVAFVTRHLPLTEIHPNAELAGRAAESAGLQGKYKEAHDILFDRQNEWSRKRLSLNLFDSYMEEIGLDMEKYKEDLSSDAVIKKVKTDLAAAQFLGLNSTPSFLLQGEPLANPRTIEELGILFDAEFLKVSLIKEGEKIHEHADIKIFLEGEQFDLSDEKYMSTADKQLHPDVHLHDGNGEMIHIH